MIVPGTHARHLAIDALARGDVGPEAALERALQHVRDFYRELLEEDPRGTLHVIVSLEQRA